MSNTDKAELLFLLLLLLLLIAPKSNKSNKSNKKDGYSMNNNSDNPKGKYRLVIYEAVPGTNTTWRQVHKVEAEADNVDEFVEQFIRDNT